MDLKTTKDVAPGEFARQAANLGYDLQATFYLLLARAAGFEKTDFSFCAVKKTPPYTPRVYVFSPYKDIEHGMVFRAARAKLERAAGLIAARLKADNWENDEDWRLLSFPPWFIRNGTGE